MNLNHLVGRLAEAILAVDKSNVDARINSRTGKKYLTGVKQLNEKTFVREATKWWRKNFPNELPGFCDDDLERPYPDLPRAKCDLMIRCPNNDATPFEWAVELKRIDLVGNNGKTNDYGCQKLLSPYRKDRSLVHDAQRLRTHQIAKRSAVVMYGFDYDCMAIERARKTCRRLGIGDECASNLEKTIKRTAPDLLEYRLDDLIEIADASLRRLKLTRSDCATHRFEGADRHPCGGEGVVAGWQVSYNFPP